MGLYDFTLKSVSFMTDTGLDGRILFSYRSLTTLILTPGQWVAVMRFMFHPP